MSIDWEAPVAGAFASSFRLGEWIAGPVTPLFEDWALTRLEASLHATHRRWVGQPAPLPHHVVVNGWYFYSLRFLPVSGRAMLRWLPSLVSHLVRHPRRLAVVIPPTAHLGVGLYEQDWREDILPRYVAATSKAEQQIAAAEVPELMALVDDLLDRAGEYFASVTIVGGAAYKAELQLAAFYRKHVAPTTSGSHLPLLAGLALPGAAPAHAVETLDWARPTLGERSEPRVSERESQQARLVAEREDAEDAAATVLRDSPRKLRRFRSLLAEAQRLAPIREEQMRQFTLPWPAMRVALLRLGQDLVANGVIEDAGDVFYLRRSEIDAILEGSLGGPFDAQVDRRRTQTRAAAHLTPPALIGDVPVLLRRLFETSATTLGARQTAGASIHGIPVSPGLATGPARVVRGSDEFGSFRPGEVLVAPLTAPAWMPLLEMATAVVTDGGNAFSHASIVARELGIPAVVGCVDATRRLTAGRHITVDGTAGTVDIAAQV